MKQFLADFSLFALLVLAFYTLIVGFTGCAHIQYTCDTYCFTQENGAQCDHIEHGWTRYNTVTGSRDSQPTVFVCKKAW